MTLITSRHKQVADELRCCITRGEYTPGSKIESRVVLAQRYHVGESTVAQAIRTLIGQGFLHRVAGEAGAWVSPRQNWPRDITWDRLSTPRCREGELAVHASFNPETGKYRPECAKHYVKALKGGRQCVPLERVPSTAEWEEYYRPSTPRDTQ